MSQFGVTRYKTGGIKQVKREGFWWADASNRRDAADFVGPTDLTDNVSWGWHHPNGFFNDIPVGSPLIDGEMNIYIGSDTAIRKFDFHGNVIWVYGPRGQLAAAPTLTTSAVRRMKEGASHSIDEQRVEDSLRPSWMGGDSDQGAEGTFHDIKEGDILKVREGKGYSADGIEFYAAGDLGEITKVTDDGNVQKAFIRWKRTGHQSVSRTTALHKRFSKVDNVKSPLTNLIVGSTTSGAVFAIDIATGEEVWVTQVCAAISGVKGQVSVKGGVIVAATDRCVDRKCYRHRYLQNPLWPCNNHVRGLSVVDGSIKWTYRPFACVWNFLPEFSEDDNATVFFQDVEGDSYALDLNTGDEKWMTKGFMGTWSQGHVIFSPWHNVLYVMLVKTYDSGNGYEAAEACNAFRTQGIHINCDTWPGKEGVIWALNGTSGKKLYQSQDLPEPPNSGTLGRPNDHVQRHDRLIVTLGHNCHYNSPTWMFSFNPDTLRISWTNRGPTLWSWHCAGDKEGGDIRRALGQREMCKPGSWSAPVVDGNGNIFVGNQVGELQMWGGEGAPGQPRTMELQSSLTTGVALQDLAIALAPGMMVVSTCTSLIVFHTTSFNETFANETWTPGVVPSLPYGADERPYGVDGPATAGKPTQYDDIYNQPSKRMSSMPQPL